MRRFTLDRSQDITGISGVGVIAYGIEWSPDGPCDLFWLRTKTTGQYPSVDVLKAIHCYNDNARVIYVDEYHFTIDE
jgi:hypothetical protein